MKQIIQSNMGTFKLFNTVISFLKNNQKLILIVLLCLAVVAATSYRDSYLEQKQETQKQIQNIEAINDEVSVVENKVGELVSEKMAFQSTKKQLMSLNAELAQELNNQKGKVSQLTQTIAQLEGETGDVDTTEVTEIGLNTYKYTWEKVESGDKWSKILEGYFVIEADSTVKPTLLENKITKDALKMEIITGVTTKDDKKIIFVRSTYPNLTFTEINGAIIEERYERTENKSRWGIGLGIGYGINSSGKTSPVIMGGITYDFIQF